MERKNISISIVSGKGGVGKTNISLNLAYMLYNLAYKVIILDCDLGLANIDILLGITPKKNLKDIIQSDVDPEELIVNIERQDLDLIPAASGIPELLEYERDVYFLLVQKLNNVLKKYDFIILDLGAGISEGVTSFAASTSLKIILITPEPTSLTDSYAVIKILKTKYNQSNFLVVVNMVEGESQARQTFERLNVACKRFLGVELGYLGYIRENKDFAEAVSKQIPLAKLKPQSEGCKDLMAIAKNLVKVVDQLPSLKKGLDLID
ncbi:MAG: MinD/ParA family protein [Desulfonauticus sp.]|nr:MinD/ParA family protein [Desulfonauticus sp.]